MSKYCLFLIVIYYLTGGNNSMSRFCKFGKLHVTKGNGDKFRYTTDSFQGAKALGTPLSIFKSMVASFTSSHAFIESL